MTREKFYFDKFSPEYNILKTPGTPSREKGWKHSEIAIKKLKLATNNLSADNLLHRSLGNLRSKKVKVIDISTGINTVYHAIKAAAKALKINRRYIENYIYLNQKSPVLGKYLFKLIEKDIVDNNIYTQKTSKKIKVIDVVTNNVTTYPSIGMAARSLGIHQASISLYLKDKRIKPFKNKYIFKLI